MTSAGVARLTSRPAGPALDAVAFVDAGHGWMAGAGIILGTSDGGRSWRREWTGDQTVVALFALDRIHAWALARSSTSDSRTGPATLMRTGDTLLRTSDGGATWTATALTRPLGGLAFVSPVVGWAIGAAQPGAAGPLLHTTDGGRSWTETAVGSVGAVCFADPQHGWAVGATTLRTTDGGRTWRTISTVQGGAFATDLVLRCHGSVLWLFQNRDGGAGGHVDYVAVRSTDAGVHWQQVLGNAFFPSTPSGIGQADDEPGPFDAPDASTAAELGTSPAAEETSVTVTHDGGKSWNHVSLPEVGLDFGGLSFADGSHGFALGSGGFGGSFLLATDDGGRTWSEQWPTTAPDPEGAISFVTSTLGYGVGVIGDARALLRTTDGGQSWTRIGELPEPIQSVRVQPNIIAFVDAVHGWVVSEAGHLLATEDSGRSWHVRSLPAGSAPAIGAAFTDPLRGCVATTPGAPAPDTILVFATTDGGSTWQAADPRVWAGVCARGDAARRVAAAAAGLGNIVQPQLAFFGDRTAWAQLDDGLAKTTDGGATWTTVSWPQTTTAAGQPVFAGSFELSFVSSTDGWMLTNDGAIYRTADGGLSWEQLP